MFGQTGSPHATECQTAVRHFMVRGASLWLVATFKSSHGAARYSLAGGSVCHIAKSEIYEGPHIFSEQGLIGFKSGTA